MSRTSKFVASVVATSKEERLVLPFQRGTARKAMFDRQKADTANDPVRKLA